VALSFFYLAFLRTALSLLYLAFIRILELLPLSRSGTRRVGR
jgi:hypothetical protein